MKIIIDAMGGDNAPQAPIVGAVRAKEILDVDICFVGKQEIIEEELKKIGKSSDDYEIVDARDEITMHDDPATAIRRKKDSSMVVALNMLKNGQGDAVVSAGSTGALLSGATLITKRIRGIRRAAMAPIIPNGDKGVVLMDCGANAECTPEYLLQFAYMGSFYAKKMMGLENPRVGLLNIGSEDTKGTQLQLDTYKLLKAAAEEGRINFIGNVEGTEVLNGKTDVVIADGFTGNVLLKSIEGVAKFMLKQLKGVFYQNTATKLAALVLKPGLKEMKKMLDVNEIGGTAFIGISKPVIKAHGSSGDMGITSAIKQAKTFAQSGIIDEIIANIDLMKLNTEET